MNTSHTVLVIGANGVLGSTVVDVLAEQRWKVLRGMREPDETPGAIHVDLADPAGVARAMQEADLTVSTVPDTDVVAERVALEQGGTLLNVSTVDPEHTDALRGAAHDEVRGTVVRNAGLAPGVTNLVVAQLIAENPAADTIELVMTFSTKGMSGRAGVEFVHRNLADSGRAGAPAGVHDTEVIPLPAPFGRRRCLGFAERERGWVGPIAEGRQVRTYACFDSSPLHWGLLAMNRVRLLGGLPQRPFMVGKGAVPAKPSHEPIAHWISVGKAGTRLAARTVECRGDYLGTADAVRIFANALLDSAAARRPGCFGPEELFTLDELRAPLSVAGIDVVDQPIRESSPAPSPR